MKNGENINVGVGLPSKYLSTLANSTLIILFSKMWNFSKIISFKSKNIVKENIEYLRIFHLLK
jgi:acyl CoA:acetate/3-ketoacid CoA transferase beta subunit